MMAQTFSFEDAEVYPLVTSGKNIELGVFSTIIHKHDINRKLTISIELQALEKALYVYARDCGLNPEAAARLSSTSECLETEFSTSDSDFSSVLSKVSHSRRIDLSNKAEIVLERSKLGDKTAFEITEINNLELALPPSLRRSVASTVSTRKKLLDIRKKIIRETSKKSPSQSSIEALLSERQSILKKASGLEYGDVNSRLKDILKKGIKFGTAQRMLRNTYLPCSPIRSGRGIYSRISSSREPEDNQPREELLFILDQYLTSAFVNFERKIRSLSHITPLREAPTRVMSPSNIYKFEENTLILQRVNEILRRLELPYSLAVEKLSSSPIFGKQTTLVLHDQRFDTEVTLSDVGFGMSQLIPIIREGINANVSHLRSSHRTFNSSNYKLLLLEQPEIHLHPKLQANLAELFWGTATLTHSLYESNNLEHDDSLPPPEVQWIIETHSEAILLRLQKLIRQKRLSPHDVSVLYVDVPKDCDSATVTKIELDDKGDFLTEWPGGFFEERLKEIFD